jgi:hypothetical protein
MRWLRPVFRNLNFFSLSRYQRRSNSIFSILHHAIMRQSAHNIASLLTAVNALGNIHTVRCGDFLPKAN